MIDAWMLWGRMTRCDNGFSRTMLDGCLGFPEQALAQ